ncbi:MAG: hypothetical protein QF733_09810 [Phycisphaerales bacterium]|jgi:hypothetical protein|nr:hypothetical protein [Phycisphaerales bacterium]
MDASLNVDRDIQIGEGSVHNNPDDPLWYGWNEMVQDLTEIQAMAEDLRDKHRSKSVAVGS